VAVRTADRPYAVIDVDGVLADVEHRLHYIKGRPKDWDRFFAAADKDPPLEEGLATARRLAKDHELVYLSGRPERLREVTLDWFARYDVPPGRLLLRDNRDRRPAKLVKLGILRRLARERVVSVLVDDDPAVCETVRKAGFPVLDATWSHRQPALFEAQEVEGRT
jgi:phosphoglycolate phosphatase-like HAD superfamily hydrolase